MHVPHTAERLAPEAGVDLERWSRAHDEAAVERAASALRERGFVVHRAHDAAAALAQLDAVIPAGAEVMTGSSTTLAEIGFTDALASGRNGWISVLARVQAEDDPAARADVRRKAVTSDWFVASVNAFTETGELVAADRSGSRIGAMPFAAGHVVLVVGTQKLVPTLSEAFERVHDFAYPLENVRAKRVYKVESEVAKILVLAREPLHPRTTVILVDEPLGY